MLKLKFFFLIAYLTHGPKVRTMPPPPQPQILFKKIWMLLLLQNSRFGIFMLIFFFEKQGLVLKKKILKIWQFLTKNKIIWQFF